MLNKFREATHKVKEVFHNRYTAKSEEPEVKEAFKERKLALYFLVLSTVVLLLKFSGHRKVDRQFISDLLGMIHGGFSGVLAFLLSLEWIATPVITGAVMGGITWCTVYLDSCVPGVHPPSPLSPKKLKVHSRTFHMGYPLAVINGVLIAAVMLHANLTHPSS